MNLRVFQKSCAYLEQPGCERHLAPKSRACKYYFSKGVEAADMFGIHYGIVYAAGSGKSMLLQTLAGATRHIGGLKVWSRSFLKLSIPNVHAR